MILSSSNRIFGAILKGAALLLLLAACQDGQVGQKPVNDPPPKENNNPPQVIVADKLPGDHPDTVPMSAQTPVSAYEQTMIDSGLVDVQSVDPSIVVDLKYSTADNFIGVDVYGDLDRAYLRPLAAQKLGKAQQLLHEIHPDYNLIVFDGCRPRRVQFIMWDTLDIPFKKNYVANPWEGSIHNYGMAVDLSIVDGSGVPLDMGTPFDFFGPKAQPQLEKELLAKGELTEAQIANRDLLRDVMRRAGFFGIHTEWWHFLALLSDEVKAKYQMIE